MKITLGNRMKIREEEDKLIQKLEYAGRNHLEVDFFTKNFQEFLSNSEIVEMHVFTSQRDVLDAMKNDAGDVVRKGMYDRLSEIMAGIRRHGFWISCAYTQKKACSQLRQTYTRA